MHKIWNILKYMPVFIHFHLLFIYLYYFHKMCKINAEGTACLSAFSTVIITWRLLIQFYLRSIYWSTAFSWVRYVHNSFFLILTSFYLHFVGVESYSRTWSHSVTHTHTHTHTLGRILLAEWSACLRKWQNITFKRGGNLCPWRD